MDAELLSGNAQILARASECDNVYRFHFTAVNIRNASEMFHVRKPFTCHIDTELFNLACPHRLNPVQRSGKRKPAGAVEQASEFNFSFHHITLTGSTSRYPFPSIPVITTGLEPLFMFITASSVLSALIVFIRYFSLNAIFSPFPFVSQWISAS